MDGANTIRWRWLSEPFGTTAAENQPTAGQAALPIPLRMPGQMLDTETGLFYNWHRSYDSTTGRYTQSDPIGLDGGINTYSYANASPLMYADRNGLNPYTWPHICRQLGLGHFCEATPQPLTRPASPEFLVCVNDYLHSNYGDFLGGMTPSFSAYSYMPSSPNFSSAVQSTVISGGIKGVAVPTLIYGGQAMQTVGSAVAPWVAGAGALEAGGVAATTLGTAGLWVVTGVGAFGLPFATTAEFMARRECSCRR
jgi:RHS repeat-associated protein